ncbi:hypothetical protein [Phosphitispora sp. TUW77]|uniref:hypothetical protein n=1 Tax=Phosphitispora sp. TUW77 TaxID=3152361 RepID=UPI003AB74D31
MDGKYVTGCFGRITKAALMDYMCSDQGTGNDTGKVLILNASEFGGGKLGHEAIAVVDSKNRGYYYSFWPGKNLFTVKDNIITSQYTNFKSTKELVDTINVLRKDDNCDVYTRWIEIDNVSDDMISHIKAWASSPTFNNPYNKCISPSQGKTKKDINFLVTIA